jgi:chromosome segregation ATPase
MVEYEPLKDQLTKYNLTFNKKKELSQKKAEERNSIKKKMSAKENFQFSPELIEQLNSLSDDQSFISPKINEFNKKIAQFNSSRINPDSPQLLDNIFRKMEDLKTNLNSKQSEIQQIKEENKLRGVSIREQIQEYIHGVSYSFGKLMTKCKYKGFVEYIPKNDWDKIEDKIEIRVSFRDKDPIRTLGSSNHSGGEKSVGLFLFI